MKTTLIFARGSNGAFGHKGGLCFKSKDDMEHFKAKTRGGAIVMGRKTWESLPAGNRPLPGRLNIVITSDRRLKSRPDLYLYFVNNFCTAQRVAYTCKAAGIFVIGGSAMLEQYQECASEAWVSDFKYEGPFDVKAPALDKHWDLISSNSFGDKSAILNHYKRRD